MEKTYIQGINTELSRLLFDKMLLLVNSHGTGTAWQIWNLSRCQYSTSSYEIAKNLKPSTDTKILSSTLNDENEKDRIGCSVRTDIDADESNNPSLVSIEQSCDLAALEDDKNSELISTKDTDKSFGTSIQATSRISALPISYAAGSKSNSLTSSNSFLHGRLVATAKGKMEFHPCVCLGFDHEHLQIITTNEKTIQIWKIPKQLWQKNSFSETTNEKVNKTRDVIYFNQSVQLDPTKTIEIDNEITALFCDEKVIIAGDYTDAIHMFDSDGNSLDKLIQTYVLSSFLNRRLGESLISFLTFSGLRLRLHSTIYAAFRVRCGIVCSKLSALEDKSSSRRRAAHFAPSTSSRTQQMCSFHAKTENGRIST